MNYVVIELDHDNIDLNWTQFKTEQEARSYMEESEYKTVLVYGTVVDHNL